MIRTKSDKLFVQDQGDHLDWLIPDALQAMAFTGGAVSYIAGADLHKGAVIIIFSLAGKNVISLAVAGVDMVADGTAGVHRGVAEHAALLGHLLRAVQQAADSDLAYTIKGSGFADGYFFFGSSNHSGFLLSYICLIVFRSGFSATQSI